MNKLFRRSFILTVAAVFIMCGFFAATKSAKAGPPPPSILINEFVSNTAGNEWVELFNASSSDIVMANYRIENGPGTATTTITNVTIPANGLVVIAFAPGNNLRDDGDVIFLFDVAHGGTPIFGVSYGDRDPGGPVLHAGDATPPDPEYSGCITDYTPGALVYSIATPGNKTKGWFNNAVNFDCIDGVPTPPGPPAPPTLGSIAACLSSAQGVFTNMTSLATDPTTATDLIFEKRTNVADPGTALGSISFAGPLNLSDNNVMGYLKSIGQKLEIGGAGIGPEYAKVGLNTYATSTIESAFKDQPATVTMYGLSGPSFSSTSAPSLIVKNNEGEVIPPTDIVNYPDIDTTSPGLGFNATSSTFTFGTSHFTTFESITDAVAAVNDAADEAAMEIVITDNAALLGLTITDPSDFFSLTNKTPVYTALLTPVYTTKEEIQTDFNAAVSAEQDVEAAAATDALISALPFIADLTLDDAGNVTAAGDSYDALTLTQQGLVTGLATLEADEAQITALTDADAAVTTAEGDQTQGNVDAANTLMLAVAAGGAKDALQGRIDVVQDIVDVATAQNTMMGMLSPWAAVEGLDLNIIDRIQSIVDDVVADVIVMISTITSPANTHISMTGVVTYDSSPETDDVTFTLTKNAATVEQLILVAVPISHDEEDVVAAQAAVDEMDSSGTWTAQEGVDTNIIDSVQAVVSSGVTVTISMTANSQVASNGDITYGSSEVTGDVTFTLTKNSATAEQTISVTVPVQMPSEVWVDSTYFDVDNDGGHNWGYDAFATIAGGVSAVAEGGTVYVNAGTYNEEIVINKALTLEGDVGDDGIGPGSDAPVIHNTTCSTNLAININANDVTVEGFILDNTCDSPSLSVASDMTGANILDNELQDSFTGIVLSPNSSSTTVMKNLIHDTYNGIIVTGSQDNIISNNEIYNNGLIGGNGGVYIDVFLGDSSGTVVSDNNIHDNGYGVYFDAGDQDSAVTVGPDNDIYGNGEGVYVSGDAHNFFVNNNKIHDNVGPESGLYVLNDTTGMDASKNWWDDSAGPVVIVDLTPTFNEGGDGETIDISASNFVFYRPFCTDDTCTTLSTASTTSDDLSSLFTSGAFVLPFGEDPSDVTSVQAAEDVTITLPDGSSVEIPADTIITQQGDLSFDPSLLSATEVDVATLTGLGAGVTAEGALEWGIPNLHLEFDPAVTLHIYVSTALNGQTLHVKRSDDGGVTWTSDGIVAPATCVVSGGICTFQATKASTYVSEKIASSGGTGGGGGGASCTSVVYDAWQSCVNGMQYRSILSQTPSSCTLTSAQQAERSKVCGVIMETPETPTATTTPSDAITSLIGANSATVNVVTAGEAQTLISTAAFANLSATEKATYLKIIALTTATLSQANQYTIADFIHAGTPTTVILGSGERAGVIASFQSAFNRLPTTEADWQDVIKIANGRWPTQRSTTAEDRAKVSFKKIYLRAANMSNPNDNAAVTVMAYGLRPALRNLNSEKAAIVSFRFIYKITPVSAQNWDIVRSISYSGAKR